MRYFINDKKENKILKATNNFFGIFSTQSLQDKNNVVLETYKLIFRFSIDRLLLFLKKDDFIIIIL